MNQINFGRVLLGGLVAGLIMNIGEFLLNGVVLGKQMEDIFRRFNVPPPGGNFFIVAILLTFVLGVFVIWLYALIRPRMGAGPKTAIIAALILWFGVYVYTGIINTVLFGFPMNLVLIGIVWGLAEYILAALAGAWLYKEA